MYLRYLLDLGKKRFMIFTFVISLNYTIYDYSTDVTLAKVILEFSIYSPLMIAHEQHP